MGPLKQGQQRATNIALRKWRQAFGVAPLQVGSVNASQISSSIAHWLQSRHCKGRRVINMWIHIALTTRRPLLPYAGSNRPAVAAGLRGG
jgi:hypothetical protein